MNAIKWMMVVLVMMAAAACAAPQTPAQDMPVVSATGGEPLDVKMLIAGGEWFHMMEENHPAGDVYRRADAGTLPPARYRRSYVFTKDKCVWLALAPNDGHRYKSSACTIDSASGVVTFDGSDDANPIQIVSLDEERLIIKRL